MKKFSIEESKDYFNKFSEMSRTELAELILNRLKEKTIEGEEGAVHSSITAEIARALFIECCYNAAVKNSVMKNDELCKFYSSVLSDAYKIS